MMNWTMALLIEHKPGGLMEFDIPQLYSPVRSFAYWDIFIYDVRPSPHPADLPEPRRLILPYGRCIQGLKDLFCSELISMYEFEALLWHVFDRIYEGDSWAEVQT